MNIGKGKPIGFSIVTGILLLAGLFLFLMGASQTARAAPADLFVTPAGSGSCAQAAPCDLQTALATAIEGDILYLAQGIYTGSGAAVISPTRSITLYGGWDGSPSGSVVRDSVLYPATLDGEGQRRVIYVNEGSAPTIDGFIITGGNGTGFGGGLVTGSEAGGGLYSLNAAPVIQNNLIISNVASTLAGVRAFGGGIYISSDDAAAVVRNNKFVSNTAGIEIDQGDGGGFFISGEAEISRNTFQENIACVNCPDGSGGGGYVGWTTGEIIIAHNLFENNQGRRGGGMALVWSAAQVNQNRFIGNTAVSGAGLDSYYDKGSNIEANQIMSNTATGPGSGVRIYITKGPEATRLVNNMIVNNLGTSRAGLYAESDWAVSAITLTHNTIVSHGIGIQIGRNMTATLVNNIVASHTVGITITDPSGNVFADHTLFWGNSDDSIRGTDPLDSDPAFVDPDLFDYHLGPTSGAIDMGIDTGTAADFDSDSRPNGGGSDIGADEFWVKNYLPLVVLSYFP